MAGYVLELPDERTVVRPAEHVLDALRPGHDVLVPPAMVLAQGLRPGDYTRGTARAGDREASAAQGPGQGATRTRRAGGRRESAGGVLVSVEEVTGLPPAAAAARPRFDRLTAIHPERPLTLERPDSVTAKALDLFAPLGFGSRVLVVSPPKAGKTTLLREIALSVLARHPQVRIVACLIGERPEEATELSRLLPRESATGSPVELVATTFDDAVDQHAAVAELTAERARRLVEAGHDVVLLVDSLTRLVRAHNLSLRGEAAGRTLTGGVAAAALSPPRRFFGAARATAEGPSLTVIATCLIETGSRQDDLVYEELKGTGNAEILLERRLADRRVFPALDFARTGTRREELLLPAPRLEAVRRLRRLIAAQPDPIVAAERVFARLTASPTVDEFLASIAR